MTDPADHTRLREIEARLEAATPGPWRWELCGDDVCDCAALSGEHYGDVLFLSAGYGDDRIPAKPEYTLIENAPADLRYLLERVRAQSERIEALEAAVGEVVAATRPQRTSGLCPLRPASSARRRLHRPHPPCA